MSRSAPSSSLTHFLMNATRSAAGTVQASAWPYSPRRCVASSSSSVSTIWRSPAFTNTSEPYPSPFLFCVRSRFFNYVFSLGDVECLHDRLCRVWLRRVLNPFWGNQPNRSRRCLIFHPGMHGDHYHHKAFWVLLSRDSHSPTMQDM